MAVFISRNDFSDAVADAVAGLVVDLDTGEILFASQTVEEMFGYIRGELPGKHVDLLLPEPLRKQHTQDRLDYAKRPKDRQMGQRKQPLTALHHNGSEFPVWIALSGRVLNGRRCAIAIIMDLTGNPIPNQE